jgi:hypothetical protein
MLVTNFAYVHVADTVSYEDKGTHVAVVVSVSVSAASLFLLLGRHMERLKSSVIGK